MKDFATIHSFWCSLLGSYVSVHAASDHDFVLTPMAILHFNNRSFEMLILSSNKNSTWYFVQHVMFNLLMISMCMKYIIRITQSCMFKHAHTHTHIIYQYYQGDYWLLIHYVPICTPIPRIWTAIHSLYHIYIPIYADNVYHPLGYHFYPRYIPTIYIPVYFYIYNHLYIYTYIYI